MLPASNTSRRLGVLRRSTWAMGFVAFGSRFLELLEIGPVDFDIRSSDCSLLFVCGLGWAGGHRKIVLIGADCASRSVLVVGFGWYRSVCGPFLLFPRFWGSSEHPGRSRNPIWILNGVVAFGLGAVLAVLVWQWFPNVIRGFWVVDPYSVETVV